jgi:hypothetical protein
MEPLWGTFETGTARYGITRRKLLELAKQGPIRARKENPDSRSARIVFRLADVKDWMENEAPTPRTQEFEPTRGIERKAQDTTESLSERSQYA